MWNKVGVFDKLQGILPNYFSNEAKIRGYFTTLSRIIKQSSD